jgi:hypothetical protein
MSLRFYSAVDTKNTGNFGEMLVLPQFRKNGMLASGAASSP